MSDTLNTASYVTTTKGGAGFFAVEVWFNPEGFWEPWETGIGRYATNAEAEDEGKEWAKDAQLEFKPSSMSTLSVQP